MKKTAPCKIVQAGFTPLPNSRMRVWNRLQRQPKYGILKRPAFRWAFAACLALTAIWGAAVWVPRSQEPMRAALTADQTFNQRYGEAGPRGQEYCNNYIPFQ